MALEREGGKARRLVEGPGRLDVVAIGGEKALIGRDGLAGSAKLAAAGATVMVQDPDSAAVWGMPRSVAEAGHACAVLDPASIGRRIAIRARGSALGASTWM